jgi:hypothetical protein
MKSVFKLCAAALVFAPLFSQAQGLQDEFSQRSQNSAKELEAKACRNKEAAQVGRLTNKFLALLESAAQSKIVEMDFKAEDIRHVPVYYSHLFKFQNGMICRIGFSVEDRESARIGLSYGRVASIVSGREGNQCLDLAVCADCG